MGWPRDLHRRLPLHPHLQLLGRGLRVQAGRGGPRADRHPVQRRLPLHGLAADRAAPAHGDRARDEGPGGGAVAEVPLPRVSSGAMIPFAYVVHTLLIGLKEATESEQDENVKQLIRNAQVWTVVSWLTYPFVYIIPMMGATGAGAIVGIQVGYCVSDIISKCGVGLIIYKVTLAKSIAAKAEGLIQA